VGAVASVGGGVGIWGGEDGRVGSWGGVKGGQGIRWININIPGHCWHHILTFHIDV